MRPTTPRAAHSSEARTGGLEAAPPVLDPPVGAVVEPSKHGKGTMRLTGHGDVRDALVRPSAADVAVVTREPDLAEVGMDAFGLLPHGRAKRAAGLVEGEGVEGVLDVLREARVVEHVRASEVSQGCERRRRERIGGDLFLVWPLPRPP